MELDPGQRHLLRLANTQTDPEGWVKVSLVVLPFVQELPAELIEIIKNDDGTGRARLTDKGRAVVDWT